jgi:hypothetical protein
VIVVSDDEAKTAGGKELRALLVAVNKDKPKSEDIAKLNKLISELPNLVAVIGDLTSQAELKILENAFSKDKAYILILSKSLKQMRHDMGYEQASVIEKSLIEHIVLCWLRLQTTEMRYEQAIKSAGLTEGAYWEAKLSSNQKRYLRSVETLARIRKLGISIQVNVAQNQVVTG